MSKLTLQRLRSVNEDHIRSAGPRYSPGVDPASPNLTIDALLSAIGTLAHTSNHFMSLSIFENDLEKASRAASQVTEALFRNKRSGPPHLAELLKRLQARPPGTSRRTRIAIRKSVNLIERRLDTKRNDLWEKREAAAPHSEEQRTIDSQLHSLRELEGALAQITDFTRSPSFELIDVNRMLIHGEWGTGKTHFLCDITRARMVQRLPTLLILAYRLPAGVNPLEGLCTSTKLARSPTELLRELDRLGRRFGGRALLIIDGINEGDRVAWRTHVSQIARNVRRYPHVGLVLSCRTPFDAQILTDGSRKLFVHTRHVGFQEIEFDAQRAFFDYYGIPNPHVPLLTPEFSRPLFLKILCETLKSLTVTAKHRQIREIAAGQKGMTKLFEDFVKHVGRRIEEDLGLPINTCWQILKGRKLTPSGAIIGIAPSMAAQLTDYLTPAACRALIADVTELHATDAVEAVFRRLVTDGLLTEDMIWQDDAWLDVVRLPYQRFSDHLICRHLLERYLDSGSEAMIRRSFRRDQPLGQLFDVGTTRWSYRSPGLASAIMLEFPERVKRTLPEDKRELVFYLPKRVRLVQPLVDTFLEGLSWRSHAAFSRQTDQVINVLLDKAGSGVQHRTFEVLVCLASRPGHPISAQRLWNYLSGLSLVNRDLSWSEFLRVGGRESIVHRLVDWVVAPRNGPIAREAASHLILLLSTLLTTTHRPLRDRATRALVLIGERHPAALFEATIESLGFNDPYVPERMLAASYGVLMRGWVFPIAELKRSAPTFARNLYDALFAEHAPRATTHVLSRDYARGVIELARKIDRSALRGRSLRCVNRTHGRPITSIPAPNAIPEQDCVEADSAMYMDFRNYTIGRLVEGRNNYDDKHEDYRGVLRQIRWRILDLGYRTATFQAIDKSIANDHFYREQRRGGRIDRYGKKYGWIAFYEVAGLRADLGHAPRRDEVRLSDSDVDPSFPNQAPAWRPSLRPIFRSRFRSPQTWAASGQSPSYRHLLVTREVDGMNGPWVLLHGFIREVAPNDPRLTFTFLRGLLVEDAHVSRLRSRLLATEYPGNSAIPDTWTDYYTYAGEIPWSRNYGRSVRTRSGAAKPVMCEAFGTTRVKSMRKRRGALDKLELMRIAIQFVSDEKADTRETPIAPERAEYVNVPEYEHVPGVQVELPVYQFGWESYHSAENEAGHPDFAAPALCDALDLRSRHGCVDLFDPAGERATLYRTFDDGSDAVRSHLLYIRRDLLERYLRKVQKKMVWINWGERDFKHDKIEEMRSKVQGVWGVHGHIFKEMIVARLRRAPRQGHRSVSTPNHTLRQSRADAALPR